MRECEVGGSGMREGGEKDRYRDRQRGTQTDGQ